MEYENNVVTNFPQHSLSKTRDEYYLYIKRLIKRIFITQISNIHAAEKYTEPKVHYRVVNRIFRTVKIFGQIIGKTIRMNNNCVLMVDDGTAEIGCILTSVNIQECKKRKGVIDSQLKAVRSDAIENFDVEDDDLRSGLSSVLNICLEELNISSCNTEYKLGTYVHIVGSVSEFFDRRVIYVDHITRLEPSISFINELKNHFRNCEKHLPISNLNSTNSFDITSFTFDLTSSSDEESDQENENKNEKSNLCYSSEEDMFAEHE